MAHQQPNIPPAKQQIQTVIYDREGNPVLTIGVEERVVAGPDGVSVQKISRNIELEDGQTWNAAMLGGPKPVRVGLCQACRQPGVSILRAKSTHGLVALENARRCAGRCGALLCPRHRKLCRDGKYRCRACARAYAFKYLLQRIFFTYEEE